MYEALLRERMDAEQAEDFESSLEQASDYAPEATEKADLMVAWGGEVG